MRLLPLLLLPMAALSAQSLTTTFAGGNNQAGAMFDITALQSVVVTGIDIHVPAGSWQVEFWRDTAGLGIGGNTTNIAGWTLIGSASGVAGLGAGVPTPVPITMSVPVAAGQTQGFYVTLKNGTALQYTNGTAVGNVFAQDSFLQFREGYGITNPIGVAYSPRVFNGVIHYQPSASGTLATNQTIGAGCGADYASFFESYSSTNAMDLSDLAFSMTPDTGGYRVESSTTAFRTPAATATTLALTDDSEIVVNLSAPLTLLTGQTSSLVVASNGYVSTATGNGVGITPSATAFLDAPQTSWRVWHDLNPTSVGSGAVKFEQVAGVAYVTWDGVHSFGTTTQNRFQFQFDLASGTVTVVFGSQVGGGPGAYLVGYSPGGSSANPGPSDLSARLTTGFATKGADVSPLSMSASTRPVIGSTWSMIVQDVPNNAVLGLDILSLNDPNIDDLASIGAPGCGLRAGIGGASDVSFIWFPLGATSHPLLLSIPNDPYYVGLQLYVTSAVLQTPAINAFGGITANGIKSRFGTF